MKILINRLKRHYKLVFLCHNRVEYRLASELDSTLQRLWPKTVHEYFNIIPKAKAALCNRLHAFVALAGLGIPSVAVGTDTRLLMVQALGLPHVYVKEANASDLEDMLNNQIKHCHREKERLLTLRTETWNRYVQTVIKNITDL